MSRGAANVRFVDKDVQSIGLIRYNTKNLTSDISGIGNFDIVQKDVLEYLRFCNDEKWDIIFLDPPYRIGADKMKDIFENIVGRDITGKDAILVYEFFFKRQVDDEIGCMKLVKKTFFGDKKVIYLEKKIPGEKKYGKNSSMSRDL